jgi:class 3 adenylate cyclase
MSEMPTGQVAFVFTDIEGSTAMLQRLGQDGFLSVLEDHNLLIRDAFVRGVEIRTEGDAFFYVFTEASDAVEASLAAQSALIAHEWPDGGTVAVRIGMHSGEGSLGGGDYVGLNVHRAARVSAAGHGGQILLTSATVQAADDVAVLDLGEHGFKDVVEPEHIFQAIGIGRRVDFPPVRSLTVRPNNLPAHTSEFVGCTADIDTVAELLETSRVVTITGPGGDG